MKHEQYVCKLFFYVTQGILEAMEFHLKRGFKPRRGVYLAFGHDEEVSS